MQFINTRWLFYVQIQSTYYCDRVVCSRKRLTNKDLEKTVETNDEWIVKRTGIKERRIAHEEEFASDISYKAVKDLMERYDKSVEDVDMIIVCTFTPDFNTPSVGFFSPSKARY